MNELYNACLQSWVMTCWAAIGFEPLPLMKWNPWWNQLYMWLEGRILIYGILLLVLILFWSSSSSDSFPILNLTTAAFECHKFKTVWKFLCSGCISAFSNNWMVDYHYGKFWCIHGEFTSALRMKPLVNHSLNKSKIDHVQQ